MTVGAWAGSGGEEGAAGRRDNAERAAREADPESVARSICLSQLERAPKTRGQLAATLRRRLVPEEVAERVLTRLEEVGLIDDTAFAAAWVSSRHGTRGLARRALGRELLDRGVDGEIVAAAVDQLDAETELETARKLAQRKQRVIAGLPQVTQSRRLVALLGRKGYPPAVAYRVVRELSSGTDGTDSPPGSTPESAEDTDADGTPLVRRDAWAESAGPR